MKWMGWRNILDGWCNRVGQSFQISDDKPVERQSILASAVPLNNTRRSGWKPDSPERQCPLLQLSTRTSKFRISSTDVAPQWVEELQPYAWSVVKPRGVKREGVYCIMACGDAGEAMGSVVADPVRAAGMETEREYEFMLILCRPKTVDVGDFAGQVVYNVLAVKRNGDTAERVGSGRILANHWEANNWEQKKIVLA